MIELSSIIHPVFRMTAPKSAFSNSRTCLWFYIFSIFFFLFLRVGAFFHIFRDLQSPLSGEKKVHALFFSRKKNTFGGDKGWQILRVKSARIEGGQGALAANVGPLERPGGYQRLTYGQPSVNPRSTLGQRSVSSLAIAGRFSLILPDSSIKTEDRRTCISQMVDFPIRKRDFRVRSWSGAFWEPLGRKKEKTKCIYKIFTLSHRSELKISRNFIIFVKILRIFRNFVNFVDISRRSQRNLLKFCDQSGAKV